MDMNVLTQKTYTFHVNGMNCNGCVLTTESKLQDVSYITRAKTSLKKHSVEVTGDFGNKSQQAIAEELSKILTKHGYTLTVEKQIKTKSWSDFKIAVPVALAFAVLFIVLQKVGLVNLVDTGNVSYGTAFIVGIIASVSTCVAVVGGLVLSMSATFAKEGDKVKPQLLFHTGRVVSFFVLGGVIGAIGSAFTLNIEATFILSLIIGLVMLILGINLLDVFHFAKRLQPSMPKFLSKHALGISKWNHALTPLFVGVATFFLPCGFTQSMQLYTLTTGSFLKGGFTMLSFALGTLPVLALISFSSFSIHNSSKAGVFFKTAGLIVIMFALFNLTNSLVVIGLIQPVFNF
ncbi:MAG: sulfite exporter TauE/SafE family protein [Candidatus Berkelbacteria bacterium]|nr:sulfite exporter TauE/SafE family protein [Candidatus Berkelbacteria bacterium]